MTIQYNSSVFKLNAQGTVIKEGRECGGSHPDLIPEIGQIFITHLIILHSQNKINVYSSYPRKVKCSNISSSWKEENSPCFSFQYLIIAERLFTPLTFLKLVFYCKSSYTSYIIYYIILYYTYFIGLIIIWQFHSNAGLTLNCPEGSQGEEKSDTVWLLNRSRYHYATTIMNVCKHSLYVTQIADVEVLQQPVFTSCDYDIQEVCVCCQQSNRETFFICSFSIVTHG